VIQVVGLVLEVAGLVLSVVGLWRTWHALGPEGQTYVPIAELRALVESAERLGRDLSHRAAARLGLGRDADAQAGRAPLDAMAWNAKARATGRYSTLSADMVLRKAVAELDRRTRDLVDRIDREEDERRDETQRLDYELALFRDRMNEAIERLERQGQRVAIDGLRLQGMGVFLVLIGLALQAI
jgi:hypothetical protein